MKLALPVSIPCTHATSVLAGSSTTLHSIALSSASALLVIEGNTLVTFDPSLSTTPLTLGLEIRTAMAAVSLEESSHTVNATIVVSGDTDLTISTRTDMTVDIRKSADSAKLARTKLTLGGSVRSLATQTDIELRAARQLESLHCVGDPSVTLASSISAIRLAIDGTATLRCLEPAEQHPTLSVRGISGTGSLTLRQIQLLIEMSVPDDVTGPAGVLITGAGTVLPEQGDAVLRLEGDALDLAIPPGVIFRAAGRLGAVSLAGNAALWVPHNRAIEPHKVTCSKESALHGLKPYLLDDQSVSQLVQATRVTFALEGSRRVHINRSTGTVDSTLGAAWRWREIAGTARRAHDQPRVMSMCAEAEMHNRRRASGYGVTRLALEAYRLIGYGLRPLRPLAVHSAVCIALAAVLIFTESHADTTPRGNALLIPRLVFFGFSWLDLPGLAADQVPGCVDTMAWAVAAVSGTIAAVAATLSLRPFLARPLA